MRCSLVSLVLAGLAHAKIFDFAADGGAMADDASWDTVLANGAALNRSLAALSAGDVFVVPSQTFYLMGGIIARDLRSVRIQIDGTLEFASTTINAQKYMREWPRTGDGSDASVLETMHFSNLTNVTFTSSSEGRLDGAGAKWWGVPGIGYLVRSENRPRLLKISDSADILLEHLFLKDSPYWTFLGEGITNLEVRYSRIEARRTSRDGHGAVDLTAFNTDGFDLSGCDGVWIHDSAVWNQDDCFDVKDNTQNVVIERVNASGVGLTIGSIASTVRNVTFRDAYMHHTHKGAPGARRARVAAREGIQRVGPARHAMRAAGGGARTRAGIYLKFRGAGLVEDVLYENIVMDEPEDFAIWIGPAQQCDGCGATDICSTDGGPCSLCWPSWPGSQCNAPLGAQYSNITLRNITINSPAKSAGVLIANISNPMNRILFDNVVVNDPADTPFEDGYYCVNVNGVATGNTSPVPPCMEDRTTDGVRS